MKKTICFLLCAFMMSFVFCGCTPKKKSNMIKAERRLAKYLGEGQADKSSSNVIDLSEGPKLRYDASFGPSAPNFDIKIVNPY